MATNNKAPGKVWFGCVAQARAVAAWGDRPPAGCEEYIRADIAQAAVAAALREGDET